MISIENFSRDNSTLKCLNAIAVPECATIALAVKNGIPALFAKKKSELERQLGKKSFDTELFFLEDLI